MTDRATDWLTADSFYVDICIILIISFFKQQRDRKAVDCSFTYERLNRYITLFHNRSGNGKRFLIFQISRYQSCPKKVRRSKEVDEPFCASLQIQTDRLSQ